MKRSGREKKCPICGEYFYVQKSLLNIRKYCSRKCYLIARKKMIGNNRLKKGEASFNHLYAGYKNRARRAGRAFDLSKEMFRVLISQQCFYCGDDPSGVYSYSKLKTCNGSIIYNGIDRKDPNFGYIEWNVVTCCKICNYAKHTMTYDEFINWIEKTYKNTEEKCLRKS